MIMRFPAGLLFTAFLISCLVGCYNSRWTGNYDKIPELDYKHVAVIDKNELSNAEKQKRDEYLKKIAAEKIPVYTINGGDQLEIRVYNHNDLMTRTIVTPDGYLGMVLIGEIKVSGLTLAQASKKIEDALSKYIRNPKVGISPFEIVSETATISGAVSKSGIYPIVNGMRLADLFAKAGGSESRLFDGQTVSAADFPNSLFIRNNKVIPVDFVRAIEFGDPIHNIPLRRGDYVFIAARESSQIFLVGDVKHPKQFLWHREFGLLELLSEGGWMNETHWENVIIIRGGLSNPKMFKVNVDGILAGKLPNVALKSGDIVYVPHDNISEYNVFVRKLFPTAQLINMLITPAAWVGTMGH